MKVKVRSHVSAVVIFAVVAVLSACSSPAPSPAEAGASTSNTASLTKVTVGVIPETQLAPMFLGMDTGIFAKHGLELDVVPQNDVASIVSGVASNHYQFGFATAVHLINSVANHIPVKAVATVDGASNGDTGNALVAGAKSGIKAVKDLAGKTVAVVGLSSLNTLTTYAMAARAGIDYKTIKLVQLPFGQMPAALKADTVDAAVIQNPFVAPAISDGGTLIANGNKEIFPNTTALAMFLTSDPFIASNPKAVQGFADAMVESQDYALKHVEEAKKTLISHLQLTAEAAESAEFCLNCGRYITAKGLQDVEEVMKKFAGLKETIAVKDLVFSGALGH